MYTKIHEPWAPRPRPRHFGLVAAWYLVPLFGAPILSLLKHHPLTTEQRKAAHITHQAVTGTHPPLGSPTKHDRKEQ